MQRREFKIWLSGYGENELECWQDAYESFSQDPGSPPPEEDQTIEEIED